jgi:hypothetical protein
VTAFFSLTVRCMSARIAFGVLLTSPPPAMVGEAAATNTQTLIDAVMTLDRRRFMCNILPFTARRTRAMPCAGENP